VRAGGREGAALSWAGQSGASFAEVAAEIWIPKAKAPSMHHANCILESSAHTRVVDKQHPHFGATYKIVRLIDDTFGVEVTIPGAPFVNVTGFGTEGLAAAWVADHEREIATGTMARSKLHLWKKDS
jgi:hypothetical protein